MMYIAKRYAFQKPIDSKKEINYYFLAIGLLIVAVSLIFYFYSGQEITGMGTTDSAQGNFTANIGTNIDCVWSDPALSISFGSTLTQGTNNYNASQNFNQTSRNETMYNVTVGSTTNVNVNITIKGVDMEYGVNIIGVGNITWASNNTLDVPGTTLAGNSTAMVPTNSVPLIKTDYDTGSMVANNSASGNTTWYRFWLDVPSLTIAGDYTGNYTMRCSQY
jgi:hypothetical protein